MWKFLAGIQREQGLQYANVMARAAGQAPPPPKQQYTDVNRRLQTLIQRHNENQISIEDFLKGVTYNIELNV